MGKNEGKNKNGIKFYQDLLMKQAKKLDEALYEELALEVNRTSALSQNAVAYHKFATLNIRVKEMTKSEKEKEKVLKEIGVITND